jgi:hypothetical protein
MAANNELTITKERIFEIISENELPYWELKDSDKGFTVQRQSQTDNIEDSIDKLNTVLNDIKSTKVFIRISNFPFPIRAGRVVGRETQSYFIKLEQTKNKEMSDNVGTGALAYIVPLMKEIGELKAGLVRAEMESIKSEFQKQIDDLKRQKNKEEVNGLMSAKEEMLMGLYDTLLPYVPLVASKLGLIPNTQPVHINHVETDTAPETEATIKSRIAKACNRLLKIDDDLVNTLELLATYAEQNPDGYKSFIPILKSQIK